MPIHSLMVDIPRVRRRRTGTAARYQHCSWTVPPGSAGPGHARRFTRGQLRRWQLDELADTAELLVSELVTNAVIHGGGCPVLSLRRRRGLLRCAVTDDCAAVPRRRPQSPDSESGRGVHLLDVLAHRWGVLLRGRGKTVWFELPAT